jgi:RNA polymerase sigma factor (sigma-70 family)
MTHRSADTAGLGLLRTLYGVGAIGNFTDGQLLERFLAARDETAEASFAALVERHGPMVLRVSQEILRDAHDAEDAFQATFLVLALRAGSVRKRESLGSWLYGIAQRVAMRSRANAARRRAHELRRAAVQYPAAGGGDPAECWPELHEEVTRLPEKYREAIVLCYLEGLTTGAAARRLGCAQGTVLSRLTRARQRLRQRMTGRGLALPAGLLVTEAIFDGAKAAVPPSLAHSVIQAAMRTAAGMTAAHAVPASVAALTEGVLTMMLRSRIRGVVTVVLATGAVAAGVAALLYRTAGAGAQERPAGETARALPPVSRHVDPAQTKGSPAGEIIARAADLSRRGAEDGLMGIAAIDPQTAKWRPIYKGLDIFPGPVSPDGRYLVYSSLGPDRVGPEAGIWVYDLTGQTGRRRIFERPGQPHWANEGRQVVIGAPAGEGYRKFETWRVNADGTGPTRLPIPDGELVLDCSRDGTWLATRTDAGERTHRGRFTLVHPDGTGAQIVSEGSSDGNVSTIGRISPDGRSVACIEVKFLNGVPSFRLFVLDINRGRRREIPVPIEAEATTSPCWSPDGSRLALNVFASRTKEGSIALVDLDGSNFRKLPLPPGRWNIHVCDWKRLAPDLAVGAPDAPDPSTPQGRYQALLGEYNAAFRAYDEARKKAKTDVERTKALAEKYPQPRSYIGRFLQFAESCPDDPAAAQALIWVAQRGFDGPEYSRAVDQLLKLAHRRRVGLDALSLTNSVSPATERLLRAVIDKNPDPYIQGLAALALGRYLKWHSETVQSIREDPGSARGWEAMFLEEGSDKERFARFIGRDPDLLMKQAELALKRVETEFAPLLKEDDRLEKTARATLNSDARAELDEIRNLCVGKPPPQIAGTDVEGQPFKLSDYRGKVVLLSFWADWCGACRGVYALERSLVERMRGKPFVLLGVNADADKEKLKELLKKESITWRSWWDGGGSANTPGPIARKFNVRGWPTLYLLDHRGIIRHRFLDTPSAGRLNSAIDALLRETGGSALTPGQ